MKCDLCNKEFANSEEVKRHKEQEHPMGEGKEPGLDPADLVQNPDTRHGVESNESTMDEPAERGNN